MEIMSFKKKSGNNYEIEINTGEKYKIYDDIILKYELLIDRKIDKKKLDKVLEENARLDAYYKGLKYLGVRMRSELEIKKYLAKCGFSNQEIVYALDRLKDEGYIDNVRYVKAYIQDAINLGNEGPKKIHDELLKLGISEKYIYPELDSISEDEWLDKISSIVSKKAKVNKNSEKMFKNKITSYLLGLGYPFELIKIVVDDVKLDAQGAFTHDADKVYNRLSLKYKDKELEYRFKNAMYSKGYDLSEISEYLDEK